MSECNKFQAWKVNEAFHKSLVVFVQSKHNNRIFLGSDNFVTNFAACFRQTTRIQQPSHALSFLTIEC